MQAACPYDLLSVLNEAAFCTYADISFATSAHDVHSWTPGIVTFCTYVDIHYALFLHYPLSSAVGEAAFSAYVGI
jgi:hypothetical protein